MPSIFSRIISGEIPCYKIAETSNFLAFLDINPLAIGHVLVIPKIEIDYIFDIETELLQKMIAFAKQTANAIEKVIPCKRIGMAVIGLEVPHAHIHLIHLNSVSDINFERPKLQPSADELDKVSERIRKSYSDLN
jgi:histidine triad (HIT) family protein